MTHCCSLINGPWLLLLSSAADCKMVFAFPAQQHFNIKNLCLLCSVDWIVGKAVTAAPFKKGTSYKSLEPGKWISDVCIMKTRSPQIQSPGSTNEIWPFSSSSVFHGLCNIQPKTHKDIKKKKWAGCFFNPSSEVCAPPSCNSVRGLTWELWVWFQHGEPWSTMSWNCPLRCCLYVCMCCWGTAQTTVSPLFFVPPPSSPGDLDAELCVASDVLNCQGMKSDLPRF